MLRTRSAARRGFKAHRGNTMQGRLAILVLLAIAHPVCAQADDRTADDGLLRDSQLPTSGPQLAQILRKRTPSPDIVKQFQQHVARLKTTTYGDRLNATAELVKMGAVVRPLL